MERVFLHQRKKNLGCSKLTVTKVEIYSTKGILLRGREVYAVSGNDIFVYSNNVFLVQVTATAVDQRGNSATQNWQKNLIKCK